MKISANPEVFSEIPAPENAVANSATTPTPSSSDFSQLVSSEIEASTPAPAKSSQDTLLEKDAPLDDPNVIATNITIDMSPLLSQLNLMQAANNPPIPVEENKQTTTEEMEVFTVTKNNKQKEEANIIAPESANQFPVPPMDVNISPNTSDFSQSDSKSGLQNQHAANKKPEATNITVTPTLMAAALNPSLIDSATEVKATSETLALIPKSETQEGIPSKFVGALSQLGEIINSHTARHFEPEATDVYNPTARFAEHLATATPSDTATKLQFLPTTIDAMLKETYSANIKIHPPELGQVTAKIKVDKDSAELLILTENNIVKNIVEANLPQLRENFQRADITLSQVDVMAADPNAKEQNNSQSRAYDKPDNHEVTNSLANITAESPKLKSTTSNSIIDTYA